MYLYYCNKNMKKPILFICGTILWSIIWWATVYYFNYHNVYNIMSSSSTIYNLESKIDKDTNTAYLTWDTKDEPEISSYLINWWVEWWLSWETFTEEKNFTFIDIPYDKIVNVNVTPFQYIQQWIPSDTIQLIINNN